MKKLLRNLSMLTLMIIGGAQMAWGALQETTTTYDFEDEVQVFSATAGAGGTTRITLGIETPSGWSSNAVKFAAAGNAANGSATAKYDFSSLTEKASQVKIEFDCFLGDNTSGMFSIGDASTRNVAGEKGAWGYNSTGAIWSIGINRGKLSRASKNTNNLRINGTDLGATYNQYLTNWIHVQLTVDITNKKTSYTVTKAGEAETIIASGTDVSFVSENALSCTQIDLFGGTSNINYFLDNLVITSYVDQSQNYYDYTIKYIYDDNGTEQEIKESSTRNGLENTTPVLTSEDKTSIFYESEKYIYTSDDANTVSIGQNTVVKIFFRKADKYSYTVTNSFSETLAAGETFEGETVYATYPKYKNVDGTLYETPKGNDYYQCSFVPTSDNYVHTITYSATDIKNVVCYSEAEEIEGLTAFTNYNANIRCSNGTAAYNAGTSPVTITTLAPGNYKLYTSVWGAANTTFTFKADGNTILEATTTGSITDLSTGEIKVTVPTPITVEGGSSGKGLDYVYIVKLPVTISLPTDYIYSTFSSELDLDFTGNADVEAYIAYSADGKNVTLKKVTKVPAGNGLVLKKLGAATTATVSVLEDIDSITPEEQNVLSENRLWPVLGEPYSADDLMLRGDAYILESDTKFSKVVKGASGELAVGKAFLVYNPIGGGPLEMNILDGEATAIKGVEVKATRTDNAVYNLQGVRVNKPTANGLYIINGKKYLHK